MPHHPGRELTPPNGAPDRMLETLWVDFVRLQRVRQEILSDFGIDPASDDKSDDDAEMVESVFAPIAVELSRLACRAAEVESKSQADMEYKAVMLSEYLPSHNRMLHVLLARSLVEDIMSCNRFRSN